MQLVHYKRAQDELMQTPPSLPGGLHFDRERAHGVIAAALRAKRSVLSEVEAKALLAAYGVPSCAPRRPDDADGVAAIAADILKSDRACVVKILSDDISHKSDVGGVRLAIKTPRRRARRREAMLEKVRDLKPEARIRGFTVQPMVAAPARARADHRHERGRDRRAAHDVRRRRHGGGGDRRYRPRAAAARLEARAQADARDAHPAPAARAIGTAARSTSAPSRWRWCGSAISSRRHEEIRELDINPLLADENGCVALDARVRVADPAVSPRKPMAIRPYPVEWEAEDEIAGIGRDASAADPARGRGALCDAFFSKLTPEDVRMRFFTAKPDLSFKFLARLTQIDYAREMAFVAIAADERRAAGRRAPHRRSRLYARRVRRPGALRPQGARGSAGA